MTRSSEGLFFTDNFKEGPLARSESRSGAVLPEPAAARGPGNGLGRHPSRGPGDRARGAAEGPGRVVEHAATAGHAGGAGGYDADACFKGIGLPRVAAGAIGLAPDGARGRRDEAEDHGRLHDQTRDDGTSHHLASR